MGIISLTCLNLHPSIRYKPCFTYLAGIVPSPNQPNMITISHVLRPLVDSLLELENGVLIHTNQFPFGRQVQVRLLALIGDIVATHKVGGFTSHSGEFFCSWCKAQKSELQNLEVGPIREKRHTLAQAQRWNETNSVAAKERLVKKTGVRWSQLNRLPYWNPVMNISLGVMHNWFEGVLQHHFRYRWGFDGKNNSSDESSNVKDSLEVVDHKCWSDSSKKSFLHLISEICVPTGVTRMPKGLGTAKNGKLKASEWHSLFAIHVPLASIDLFFDGNNPDECKYPVCFDNLCALVRCTHLAGAKKVHTKDSTDFDNEYQKYLKTSEVLYPNLKALPNHHYALHLGTQLSWWGPLTQVAEFAGERLIGVVQKYKTNSRGKLEDFFSNEVNLNTDLRS